MIQKLDHRNKDVSQQIRGIFQASYSVEAELLKATHFPPLKRPLEDYINCANEFYGLYLNDDLATVVEIKHNHASIHIQSLVVHPRYFRQGLAKKMVQFVLDTYHTELFTVETGADNIPATQLYKKFGFVEVKQWDTDHGVRKVRFEKKISIC